MAETQLTTTPGGGGTQTATQSPQSATQGSTGGTNTSGVQPGTTSSLLEGGNGGVQLTPTALSTVNLSTSTSAGTGSNSVPPPAKHHISPALIALPVALFVLAVLLVWFTARSAKNTTHY